MVPPIDVAPGVRVFTSRTMLTTSTVLHRGGSALLVDPAWHADELSAIADDLDARGLRVAGGVATHAHHDHLLWHPRFGDAPRWASPRAAAVARGTRDELIAQLGDDLPAALVALMGRVDAMTAGPLRVVPGLDVELVAHDGHAPGHLALWLPGQRVLIAGDMLSDVELPLPFDPDDVPAYLHALDVLAPYARRAEIVIPGHGHVGGDAPARLAADRRYLDDVLRRGRSGDPRIANPGMAEEYARLLGVVGRSR
ncbi:MBL fold metallo-hydrolase [Microbacterium sp. No. 7]|uniref:MBL fold metallo-hydrolase n=1 Tax=Microbacterium sp. No. 7 TaxID=1714373 RepID=UPI0006D201C6|nr:MBL fold metallo-hydrolase [Microbacterium sp. No. 7]ALJ20841.1 Zn-dependent hydrolase [Microbacterium sp. No. 7]